MGSGEPAAVAPREAGPDREPGRRSRPRARRRPRVGAALACALALGACDSAPERPVADEPDADDAAVGTAVGSIPGLPAALDGAPLPSLAPILEAVTPAVVNVSTVAAPARANPLMDDPFYRRFFGGGRERGGARAPRSLGSGVIVDAEAGIVVTNEHVVDAADGVIVTLADGRELAAERLGADPDADIAVLRVEPEGLDALEWADSDALRVGDFTIAIGNPFGLGQTVTSGIVSALGRSGLGIQEFEDFIQTDASINPGNSGGALVGLDGRLIGINTAIVGPAGGNVGIGFAIPANLARDLVEQIVETGEVRRGALGITAQALTPALARSLGLEGRRGVVIAGVAEGSAAERAGLAPGDLLVGIEGVAVDDVAEVRNRIGLVRVGREIRLSVVRDGEPLELVAALDERPPAHAALAGAGLGEGRTRRGRPYVAVESLEADSPLARAGLREGDVILAVGRRAVGTVAELEALAARAPEAALTLRVQRGRAVSDVRVTD